MPSRSITDRLNDGEHILMDGGTGSEVQRRGANVHVGATRESDLQCWSATSNVEFADVVQQVHQDYIRCGADLILSNNFWTTRTRLARIGLADDWEKYARAGGENAVAARDRQDPEAYVAGAFAPPTFGSITGTRNPDVDTMGRDAFREEVREQAAVLADTGVDIMFPEFVGHIADCVEMVDVCSEFDMPLFLSVRGIQRNGLMGSGESLADLGRALEGMRGGRCHAYVLQSGGHYSRAAHPARDLPRSRRRLSQHRLQPHGAPGRPQAHRPEHPQHRGILPVPVGRPCR